MAYSQRSAVADVRTRALKSATNGRDTGLAKFFSVPSGLQSLPSAGVRPSVPGLSQVLWVLCRRFPLRDHAAPACWGPSGHGDARGRRAASCCLAASWFRLLWRGKNSARDCAGVMFGRVSRPPRSVSGLPRSQRQTIPSVTRRHSILTGPGLVRGGASGAVFRHHDAGASLRAAAVTTCRWR